MTRNIDAATTYQRLAKDAGIAIGPILFIIAVLGILAAAIAAGSGSFTIGTTNETNKARASAIIDIGQNLKIGMDRILGNGVEFTSIVIDEDNTSDTVDLFSPAGGGIAAPSTTMAATPGTDVWSYPLIAVPKLGTSSGSRVAVIRVSEGVCDDINSKANALAAGVAHTQRADLGDFTATTLNAGTNWPNGLKGKSTGCVENTNAASTGFYFFQVMGIR